MPCFEESALLKPSKPDKRDNSGQLFNSKKRVIEIKGYYRRF
jgi:hypothetical protein